MGAFARTPSTVRAATASRLVALAVAGLLSTAACGSATTGSSAEGTTSPTASATSSAPVTGEPGGRMTEGISEPLVLVRTGGIGGQADRLELRPDATCTVTSKGRPPVTRQLDEGQFATIVHALQRADLPQLAAQAATTSPSATERRSDQLSYLISADGVTYSTTETTAPDVLRPLLEELDALLSAPSATS